VDDAGGAESGLRARAPGCERVRQTSHGLTAVCCKYRDLGGFSQALDLMRAGFYRQLTYSGSAVRQPVTSYGTYIYIYLCQRGLKTGEAVQRGLLGSTFVVLIYGWIVYVVRDVILVECK